MTSPRSAERSEPSAGSVETGRVGVAVVGLGGAVATTAVAGLELLRQGTVGLEGLPLAGEAGLVAYDRLVFGGWDLCGDDLATAATAHGVLDYLQLRDATPALAEVTPWPAAGSADFCRNIGGESRLADGLRAQCDALRADLRRFAAQQDLARVVVLNLASTERWPSRDEPALLSAAGFEAGLDRDDPAISPAMLYAYAALREGMPYANFTPSLGADVPALVELATTLNVPVAGKDGKTGQTMMKTVLAPALRSRALRVEGWYSTNILGNRDGLALDDPASLASKIGTKGSVLDDMLGYHVEDHVVRIDYYRPRGDAKEAWDNVDLVGFLGQRMQLKVDFLCRDSVLAAPLAVEIVRLLDLAQRRGEGGVIEQLGFFFKAPQTAPDATPVHALHEQERILLEWLHRDAPASAGPAAPGALATGPSVGQQAVDVRPE